MNKNRNLAIYILSIASALIFIVFQIICVSYFNNAVKQQSRLINDFRSNYDKSNQMQDEKRKDELVEILLKHAPDREQNFDKIENFLIWNAAVFSSFLIGINAIGAFSLRSGSK